MFSHLNNDVSKVQWIIMQSFITQVEVFLLYN